MTQPSNSRPVLWRGVPVGTVEELSSDMYWWHARWSPSPAPESAELIDLAEAGEEPEVLIGEGRFRVTAATPTELELKNAL